MNKQLQKNSPVMLELQQNIRLHWLLLLIAVILLLSLTKSLSDSSDEFAAEVQNKLQMLGRLQRAADDEVPDSVMQSVRESVETIKQTIPVAQSVSVAEAEALSAVSKLTTEFISDGRASLVGSSELNFGTSRFWQVRVEYQGKMSQRNLSGLLAIMDGSKPALRIISLRYRPGRSDSITVVLDFLYRNAKE
ncbi:hypothetical protein [Alteromonas gilva]|uniref:Uncharacterized protein n=1 Tax=Alteromonas gilva TaxID=2987522 RepID=A0ABT5LA01_9ALTE|nr:hypothetical protein [Alteromonas gilva]MDC8833002.1 hypothetical protein [Alteromonas gilva]